MLHCGIVGLPLSGKTTIFNVITRAGAEVKPYAGGRTDPNRAVVGVPDARFDRLVEVHVPKKETPAQVEFVDLAGISRGAGKGAGLGNGFLSFVADADALIHVIRCFENAAVEHPEGSVDPLRDLEILELELIFRDLAV
ncbi:MAG: 50S ribosome-binding GTPase, partial [Synergistaceae bacterium]|nr:50S ribosome-binding GTPase [Synergistaceae bacterium]